MAGDEGLAAIWVVLIVFVVLLIFSIPMGCVGYYYGDEIRDRVVYVVHMMEPNKLAGYQGFANVGAITTLKDTESYEPVLKEKAAVLAVLADWCGHCTALKGSGELELLAAKVPVVIMKDTNPKSKDVFKKYSALGYPAIILIKNGEGKIYTGERTSAAILKELGVQ